MGCGGPLSHTGAGCRPDVPGRLGDTSGVRCANARALVRGALLPRRAVTCKNPAFHVGCRTLRGIPGCRPSCDFSLGSVGLETRSFKRVVPQNGSHRESGGLGRFCGTPKRRCPAIPSRISWGPSRGLQVQGGLFGYHLCPGHGGPYMTVP